VCELNDGHHASHHLHRRDRRDQSHHSSIDGRRDMSTVQTNRREKRSMRGQLITDPFPIMSSDKSKSKMDSFEFSKQCTDTAITIPYHTIIHHYITVLEESSTRSSLHPTDILPVPSFTCQSTSDRFSSQG
jgi:hypothetical protein